VARAHNRCDSARGIHGGDDSTLRFTLSRAAEGFGLWGDTRTAAILQDRVAAKRPRSGGPVWLAFHAVTRPARSLAVRGPRGRRALQSRCPDAPRGNYVDLAEFTGGTHRYIARGIRGGSPGLWPWRGDGDPAPVDVRAASGLDLPFVARGSGLFSEAQIAVRTASAATCGFVNPK